MKYLIVIGFLCCAGFVATQIPNLRAGQTATDAGTKPAAGAAAETPKTATASPDAPAARKYPVRIQTINSRPLHYEVHAIGNLEPQDLYRIDSQVAGTIYDVSFNEGDEVKSGQILMRIAPDAYRLVAARDEAIYHQAIADLANTKRKDVNQIAISKFQLGQAKMEYARRVEAKVAGAISTEELQLYEARRDVASVQEKDAEEAVETEIKSLEATVAEKEAVWKVSLDDIRKSTVLPPIPGKIDKRYVTNGMFVASGTPLAMIVDRRVLKLRFKISEQDSAVVKPNDHVSFSVPAWPGKTFDATVYEISDQVDTDARVVSCLARIEKNTDKLLPGYFASVELATGGSSSAVVVPSTAILTTEKGFVAYVIHNLDKDPSAEKRLVKVGLSVTDNSLEILSGLENGEALVIEGASSLDQGYSVTVLPPGNVVESTQTVK